MLFYGREFYDDINVQEMSYAEQGMYLRLCWLCWAEGSIPQDPARVARILKMDPDEFTPSASAILGCFREGEPGRLIHPKVEKLRQEADEIHCQKSRAGRLGNEKRWRRDRTDVTPDLQVPVSDTQESGAVPPALKACFDRVAAKFPNCTGYDDAFRSWMVHCERGVVTEANAHEVEEGLQRYLDSDQWERGYIGSFYQWILRKKWQDHPKPGGDVISRQRRENQVWEPKWEKKD